MKRALMCALVIVACLSMFAGVALAEKVTKYVKSNTTGKWFAVVVDTDTQQQEVYSFDPATGEQGTAELGGASFLSSQGLAVIVGAQGNITLAGNGQISDTPPAATGGEGGGGTGGGQGQQGLPGSGEGDSSSTGTGGSGQPAQPTSPK